MDIGWKFGLAALIAAGAFLPCADANAATSATAGKSSAAPAKSHKTTHHRVASGSKYHYRTYFVPPPPAYMPSMVPALMQQSPEETIANSEFKRPVNPYTKYIHNVGGDQPTALQTRKGVVTWANRT